MIGTGWTPQKVEESGKFQWVRSDTQDFPEMMLNTDMCLAFLVGPRNAEHDTVAADNGNCCLWTSHEATAFFTSDAGDQLDCECQGRSKSEGCTERNCCKLAGQGCAGHDIFGNGRREDRKSKSSSAASMDAVLKYALDTNAWLDDLLVAWKKVTENGQSDLCTDTPVPESDFPAELLTCQSGQPALKTTCKDADAMKTLSRTLRDEVIGHYNHLDDQCDEQACPKGDLAGCLVRLAGHDLMDFDPIKGSGGSDGCIDFADPDNNGLKGCLLHEIKERDSSDVSLESMWQNWCTEISVADFFVIAAEALIEASLPEAQRAKMRAAFEQQFRFGRETKTTCSPGALPNPEEACDAVEANFITNLGLNWTTSTALMGVHTIGRALPENSGFDGFWVSGEGGRTFDNQYFKNMIGTGWMPQKVEDSGKFQWVRSDTEDFPEMMLNTDMCLAFLVGPRNAEHDTVAADNGNCCLWTSHEATAFFTSDAGDQLDCECQGRSKSEGCTERNCCRFAGRGCSGHDIFGNGRREDRKSKSSSAASMDAVLKYSLDTSAWLDDLLVAWRKVTENGQSDLCTAEPPTTPTPAPTRPPPTQAPTPPPTPAPTRPPPTPAPTPPPTTAT